MAEPKWTPGPWTIDAAPHRPWICSVGTTADVWAERIVQPGESYPHGSSIADARLIAAAPELYGRLAILIADIEHNDISRGDIEAAKNALAKARGDV